MARRITRTGIQLIFAATLIFTLVYFLDSRYRVLPTSIHNHLPAHHPGFVITDITVKTCSIKSCKLDPEKWLRIEKDLYLKSGLISKAYVHVQRKREEDLTEDDKVVLDVKVGRLDPSKQETADKAVKWEKREAGVWLKRSSKKPDSDSDQVITAIDVLFGGDAVDPRPGWHLVDLPMLLDNRGEKYEARLSVRRGAPVKIEKPVPRIRKDGKFKVMQVSDLHLSTGLGKCRDPNPTKLDDVKCDADPRTLEFVAKQLDHEKPDLVVLSGDQVNGETAPDAQSAVFKIADLLITRKIPFAAIFGNHDDEGSLSRSATVDLLSTLPYSLTIAGPNTIPGIGNYAVEIMAHSTQHSAVTLYMLDTHAYSPQEKKYKGYDWIKPEQITWFKDAVAAARPDHNKYSHIHLDMAFIHIPLPEYREVDQGPIKGEIREGVTAPVFNSGFRDALVEMGISAVSCGHDHANDYCLLSDKKHPTVPSKKARAETKDESVKNDKQDPVEPTAPAPKPIPKAKDTKLWMCYAGGSGFGGYGGYNGYIRRVRLFEFDMNDARITTWKKTEWGEDLTKDEIVKMKYDHQTIVDEGRVVADVE